MSGVKPNNFPQESLPLTGQEEIYSQTNGINTKFTVQDILDKLKYVLDANGTAIPNYYLDFSGDSVQVYGAKVDFTNLADGQPLVHNLNVKTYIYVEIVITTTGYESLFNPNPNLSIVTGSDPNQLEEVLWNNVQNFDGFAIIHYIPN